MRRRPSNQIRGEREAVTVLAPYLPIVLLFALATLFALFSVSIAPFTGPKRFPIKYFLTAMLFIIFDIETIFLYPYAVANKQLGLFGLVEMIFFIVTVFIAYTYVWRRGGLDWN